MSINYPIVIGVAVLVLLLIVFFIIRNNKDKEEFEKEIIESELEPDKHED